MPTTALPDFRIHALRLTQARDSIRKLAALNPSAAWAGHADPVGGEDVAQQLERAAAASG